VSAERGSAARSSSTSTDSAAAFYDRWSGLYELVSSHAPGAARLRARAVDALRLERGDTVVEVGCGTGANLPLLAREVGPTGTVIGIDRSRGVLKRARNNTRAYPQIELLRADGTELPIRPEDAIDGEDAVDDEGGVDGVLATFVVGMLDDPAAAVEDWIDHLEPGGHVALLHLRRSDHAIAPIANSVLQAVTVLSTPPTTRVRYDRNLSRELDRRVRAAGDVVRSRTDPTVTEAHVFDLVELVAGRRTACDIE
jgi:ubiquinone/menaquinone biosynthesis C-methylase UbiE